MTSKHHGWQKQWRADLAARTAAHASGFVVQFEPIAPGQHVTEGPHLITCTAWDGARHAGHLPGGEDGARAWLATQPALRDPTSQRNRLARLMREAAQTYTEALHADHRTQHADEDSARQHRQSQPGHQPASQRGG